MHSEIPSRGALLLADAYAAGCIVSEQVQPPFFGVIELNRLISEKLAVLSFEAAPSLLQAHTLFCERWNESDIVGGQVLDFSRRLRIVHVGPQIEIVGRRSYKRRNLSRLDNLALDVGIRDRRQCVVGDFLGHAL